MTDYAPYLNYDIFTIFPLFFYHNAFILIVKQQVVVERIVHLCSAPLYISSPMTLFPSLLQATLVYSLIPVRLCAGRDQGQGTSGGK